MRLSPPTVSAIAPDEGFRLLRNALGVGRRRAVLAVSGGPDSLALLVLAGENAGRFAANGIDFRVVTVDHGLRPEAAEEAAMVAAQAGRYGLAHETLAWRPRSIEGNVAAAARAARYRLLSEAAARLGSSIVLAAHHQDDQIETHLMAAERGEGTLRLAAMRACRDLSPGLVLGRPFLDMPKARLVETLRARGIAWAEDPGNRDLRSARVRWRTHLGSLDPGERRDILKRIGSAQASRAALEGMVADLMSAASVDAQGVVRIERVPLCDAGPGGMAALLSRALSAAGGATHPARGGEIARLMSKVRCPAPFVLTLAGCRIEADASSIEISREFGRSGPPEAEVHAGLPRIVFDERFEIVSPPGVTAGRLVPLGVLGRGGRLDRTLPVLLDPSGDPRAAHRGALARLGHGITALEAREIVSWRLGHDLQGVPAVDQNAAKAFRPVGKELAADYLRA